MMEHSVAVERYADPMPLRGTWRKAQLLPGQRKANEGWYVIAGSKMDFVIVAYCEHEAVADLIIKAGNEGR